MAANFTRLVLVDDYVGFLPADLAVPSEIGWVSSVLNLGPKLPECLFLIRASWASYLNAARRRLLS